MTQSTRAAGIGERKSLQKSGKLRLAGKTKRYLLVRIRFSANDRPKVTTAYTRSKFMSRVKIQR